MKIVKRNIKLFIGIIIGVLLTGGIGAYAVYNYQASEINYTRNGITKKVSEALNELYEIQSEQTEMTSEQNSIADLELVTDLTTDNESRKATVTSSFTGEKDQEYYLIGSYIYGKGGDTGKTVLMHIQSIVDKMSFENATIVEQYPDLDMIKIKAINDGKISITMNTGATNETYRAVLKLKVFK